MSLDFSLEIMDWREVYECNITHNLAQMAFEAGIWGELWGDGERLAKDIIEPLEKGLTLLLSDPDRFSQFNPRNGWGTYGDLVKFVSQVINAAKEYPEARVRACR